MLICLTNSKTHTALVYVCYGVTASSANSRPFPWGRPPHSFHHWEGNVHESCQDNSPSKLKWYFHYHCWVMPTSVRMPTLPSSGSSHSLFPNQKADHFWKPWRDLLSRWEGGHGPTKIKGWLFYCLFAKRNSISHIWMIQVYCSFIITEILLNKCKYMNLYWYKN